MIKTKAGIVTLGATIFGLAMIISAFTGTNKSAGAPIANTNAPGELSCAQAGCHAGTPNSGPGSLTIAFNGENNTYQAGQEYLITVSMNEPGIDKFGFQATSLSDADSTFAGALSLQNALRTQILEPTDTANPYYGRKYITHTLEGNEASTTGSNNWSFYWKAPDADLGNITVYVAGVAANGDNVESGDNVYLDSLTLSPGPSGISIPNSYFSIYPNPFSGQFQLQVNPHWLSGGPLQLELFDIQGKKILAETINKEINIITANLPEGAYFYNIRTDNNILKSGKIIAF